VAVGDSGPGLPRSVVDRLPLHTTKPHGSGLGLFLVGAVAENHAGSLEVGTSPLGGAEMRIVLPCRR
jgi:nitrogen-specific signal transduction histidine kinase